MPRVFVTSENPELDFAPAMKYTDDQPIAVFPPGQIHLSPTVAVNQARSILRSFTRDDYLALVGDPVKIGICVAVAAQMLGRVKLLKWNRHTHEYLLVEVAFE